MACTWKESWESQLRQAVSAGFRPKLVLNLFFGGSAYLSGVLSERREMNTVTHFWANRYLELRSSPLR